MLEAISRLFRRPAVAPAPATAAQPAPASQAPAPTQSLITAGLLRALGCPAHSSESWSDILRPLMEKSGINTPRRVAAFLANCSHETGGFTTLTENLNYRVDALISEFGRHRISIEQARMYGRTPSQMANQPMIANILYGGEWGRKNLGNTEWDDGWRFRGRGLIQLTGRANYARFGATIGLSADELVRVLESREGAASSAVDFFVRARCLGPADLGNIVEVRRIVNGGSKGLKEVQALYARALKHMGAE